MKTLFWVPILCMALLLALGPACPAPTAGNKRLEVFSWWTSGGEAVALEALFKVYKHKNPKVEFLNAAVTGGGGSAARPVLQTRLAAGNPPDTWQVHPGHELFGQYVQAGYCVPLTVLYQSEGWDRVVPQGLLDQVSKGGEVHAVLVGVHRGNVLWYNKNVLEKHGIKVGDTLSFEQFFSAAQKLKAAGLAPLAMGDSGLWATAELFENTLLGVLGPRGWRELFGGEMMFDDPRVKQAARLYSRILDYQNADHSALSWDQAVRAVIQGKAAFIAMGDWTYAELVKAGLGENRDFGWVSSPRIVSAFDGAFDFRLDLWNFQVLAMPQINKTAAKVAAKADLVILSMCRKWRLPPEVKHWMETWPSLITDTNPAVAAPVENHESNYGATTCTLCYLRSVAVRYGLSLFTHKTFRGAKGQPWINPDEWQLSPVAHRFPFHHARKAGPPDSFVSHFGTGAKRANGNFDSTRKYA